VELLAGDYGGGVVFVVAAAVAGAGGHADATPDSGFNASFETVEFRKNAGRAFPDDEGPRSDRDARVSVSVVGGGTRVSPRSDGYGRGLRATHAPTAPNARAKRSATGVAHVVT